MPITLTPVFSLLLSFATWATSSTRNRAITFTVLLAFSVITTLVLVALAHAGWRPADGGGRCYYNPIWVCR